MACHGVSRVLFIDAWTFEDFQKGLQDIIGLDTLPENMNVDDVIDIFVRVLQESCRERRIILAIDNVSKYLLTDPKSHARFKYFLRDVGDMNVEPVVVMSSSDVTTFFTGEDSRREYLYMEPFPFELAVSYLRHNGMPDDMAAFVATKYSRRAGGLSRMISALDGNFTWHNVRGFVERSITLHMQDVVNTFIPSPCNVPNLILYHNQMIVHICCVGCSPEAFLFPPSVLFHVSCCRIVPLMYITYVQHLDGVTHTRLVSVVNVASSVLLLL
jgi:hypothetical protein